MKLLRAAEMFGPSGAGKSTIYNKMLENGGFEPNPHYSVMAAMDIIEASTFEDISRFYSWLNFQFMRLEEKRDKTRACGIMRALSKVALCRTKQADSEKLHMVIDGGLLHRTRSIDHMGLDCAEYLRRIPKQSIGIFVNCPLDVLKERNAERAANGDFDDRGADSEKSLEIALMAKAEMGRRGIPVLDVDSTQPVEYNAAKILSTLHPGQRSFDGVFAEAYDEKRDKDEKWHNEDRIIRDMLSDMSAGDWVTDIPCGTGRFIPYYEEKGFCWRGFDISKDMLEQARAKVTNTAKAHLDIGDVRDIPLRDKSTNAALMIRMTRWLSPSDCQQAMRELQRIARDRIIFTARVSNSEHARPYGLFTSVLDGWEIHRDEAADGDAYRVIELRPK